MPPTPGSAHDIINRYLGTRKSIDRVGLLKRMRTLGVALPLPLVADLLCLELPLNEQANLLELADGSVPDQLEDFLTKDLGTWHASLALLALDVWQRRTQRRYWRRLLQLPRATMSVRMFSYCLEHVWSLGGKPLLTYLVGNDTPDASIASQAYPDSPHDAVAGPSQALLLRRLVQWGIDHAGAMELAERLVLRTLETPTPASPAILFASEYLARFAPDNLFNLISSPLHPRMWSEHLQGLYLQTQSLPALLDGLRQHLSRPLSEQSHDDFYREFFAMWPPLWLRHRLDPSIVKMALAAVVSRPFASKGQIPGYRAPSWEMFAGIAAPHLRDARDNLLPADLHQRASELLGSLLNEEAPILSSHGSSKCASDLAARTGLFDLLYRGHTATKTDDKTDSPWSVLSRAILAPGSVRPPTLLAAGRKLPAVFAPCLYRVIERHKGKDTLLPGLADQLQTTEHGELVALVQALVGLQTSRSLDEAVRLLGRSDLTMATKLECVQLLESVDLSGQQAELRRILAELSRPGAPLTAKERDLVDALRSLLVANAPLANETPNASAPAKTLPSNESTFTNDANLDAEVCKFVPRLLDLPLESQRALRMARFILRSLPSKPGSGQPSMEAIDISPVVDLQYKALEIFFRVAISRRIIDLVQSPSHILQRKLDLIGYGRPGIGNIEAFESYLMALPVVADIPEFSSFKLRRLLAAIAGHKPGKRFVLDGLKAYAIAFVAFSRERCDYGLSGLLPTGFSDERQVLEFARDLHLMHGIRNQSAHEGLPGHRLKEADSLWHLTGSLFARAMLALGSRPALDRSA